MFTPFLFGWARPIPIDSRNFRNPRLAWRCIAASEPLSNLAMAVLWGVVLVLTPYLKRGVSDAAGSNGKLRYSDQCDFVRAQHHPHPALGRRHFHRHLPVSEIFASVPQIEPYGTWIILLLMLTGVLGAFIAPIVRLVIAFVQMFV